MSGIPEKIRLEIVTPSRSVLIEDVDEVTVPGSLGCLGILPGHRPLLSTLGLGEVAYRQGARWHHLACFWGFVEVLPDKVIILADVAERAGDIDTEEAKRARENAEVLLRGADADYEAARAKLEQAIVRMEVAAKNLP